MWKKYHHKGDAGFTLVELAIAMVVASIAMGGILSVYISQTRAYSVQDDLADMQQKMRAAIYLIKNDIRNAGRNPLMDGTVGITDILSYNVDADNANGYPGITMSGYADADGDGSAEISQANIQTISYRVMDADGDGRRELRRQTNGDGNWHLVMDGIEDIGFAYAVDADNDLDLDRAGAGANATIVWAVDTGGDNILDTNADANGDGDIDESDYNPATGALDTASGALASTASVQNIRAVQIWLLCRSENAFPNYSDTATYVLGNRMLDFSLPANAGRRQFRHSLLTGAVAMFNYQRLP